MKPPKLSNGIRYTYGPDGERICIGASMGRRNHLPPDPTAPIKLNLYRLRMTDGGAYDEGGAYWGIGTPLYRACGDGPEEQHEVFLRAHSREEAKADVRKLIPGARFYR